MAKNPADGLLRSLLGNLLRSRGEDEGAAAAYREAIALGCERADIFNNLGALRQDAGRNEEARRCYDDALRCEPDNVQARFNLALLHLLEGDFEQGLEGYELRWSLPELVGRVPQFLRPAWQGEPLEGRTLLVYTEQGFGDSIQFARYIPAMARAAGRVVVHCPAKLHCLLQRSFPGVSCHASAEALPEFDVRAPLLSLPRLLRIRPDAVPTEHPYLRPDVLAVAGRRRELAERGARLKVGLCWATDSLTGQHRSIPAAALAALAGIPGVDFYSLQRDMPGLQRPPLPLIEPAALKDFDDDAAFVRALDLVITMDTAIAHLAGAVGAKVWTVLSYPPDWRWGLASGTEGARTNWYPSMRLFRPARKGDWTGILGQVATALRALARGEMEPS
jgi:hypothetical protein